ncbi:YbhN family protein (plasmid) [Haloferax sp. S1W]|uniref:YbhN family protein n=1 Tax=Haloferax sp. S1W TaxID=3377110 RepID=UPI0037C9A267
MARRRIVDGMVDSDAGQTLALGGPHRWLRSVGFFLLGGVLLASYLWVIGIAAVQQALLAVPPRRLASLVLIGFVPFLFWGGGLHLVLRRLGRAGRPVTSLLLVVAAGFLNSITPFGQVGGDPLAALLFKPAVGTDFERGLVAIGSVNALNRAASLFLGLLGVGYLGSRVAFDQTLQTAAFVVVGLVVVALVGVAVAWQYRRTLVARGSAVLARLLRPIGWIPTIDAPGAEQFERRGYRFVGAIGLLAASPGTLGAVFVAGIAGQLAVAAALWVALTSLGVDASFALVLLVIPLAKLSGVSPTPGGFGSAEALLTALLVTTTGILASVAGAAVLLYRASVFWLPSLGGAVVTAWYATRGSQGESDDSADSNSNALSAPPADVPDNGVTAGSPLPTLVLAVTATLVVLLVVVVHRRQLLIEPDHLLVHVVRDAGLAAVSFSVTWVVLRRLSRRLTK